LNANEPAYLSGNISGPPGSRDSQEARLFSIGADACRDGLPRFLYQTAISRLTGNVRALTRNYWEIFEQYFYLNIFMIFLIFYAPYKDFLRINS
jgi:hypothetical protein